MASISQGGENLSRLRRRFIQRASTLLDRKQGSEFAEAIRTTRREWNATWVDYLIHASPNPPEVLPNEKHPDDGMYWPSGVVEERIYRDSLHDPAAYSMDILRKRQLDRKLLHLRDPLWKPREFEQTFFWDDDPWWNWRFTVQDVCDSFWSNEHFDIPDGVSRGALHHPAESFVSACLLYEVWLLEPAGYFSEFSLRPIPAVTAPMDAARYMSALRQHGELSYYKFMVEEMLADEPEKLMHIREEAIRAGFEHEERHLPLDTDGGMAIATAWYLPIIDGISSNDIKNAATHLSSPSERVARRPSVADLVATFDSSTSQQKIAYALGIDEATVRLYQSSNRK